MKDLVIDLSLIQKKNEIERGVRLFKSSEIKTFWRSSLCDNNMHLTKQKIINSMPVTGGDSA